jgi:hypothetical protein
MLERGSFCVTKQQNNSRYTVNASVRVKSAEVFEHAGNSAIYEG